MNRNQLALIIVSFLSVFSLWVVWPQQPNNYLPGMLPLPERGWIDLKVGDQHFVRKGMTLGLDLQGGIDVLLEADLTQVPVGERERALEGVRQVIERRVNAFGVTEPVIQKQGADRISIQLPGVQNVDEAKALIGKTAKLDFRELPVGAPSPAGPCQAQGWTPSEAPGSDGAQKQLTGAYFKPNAQAIVQQQTGRPEVSFELTDEGAFIFERITQRLVQRPLGIFLDGQCISAPTVQAVLRDRGIITGLSLQEAQTLAIQLNAGALPVPVEIKKERTVDAILGADSVRKSVIAGEIGLLAVLLFMLAYYRLPGLLAGTALICYTLFVLAIFKLIPVTLTLAGIAAFIVSVGMAVDANILIFERTKEEVRAGRTVASAIEAGFDRAWLSIRDSNMSTIITCLILWWFGSSFGASLVTGFAVTLLIGVLVSMFSAIWLTRTFLRIFMGRRSPQRRWLFGLAT